MGPHSTVRTLFSHFQNLNLLVLREDLRRGWTARGDWSSSGTLCPVAHGLPAGVVVQQLRWISQAVNLEEACRTAARHLGASPTEVYQFVCRWDESSRFSADTLLHQLDEIWTERLADADCLQSIIVGDPLYFDYHSGEELTSRC